MVGAVEAGDQVQQRRLAAAARADEGVEGAGLERERDASDGVDGLGPGAEAAAHVLELHELLAGLRSGPLVHRVQDGLAGAPEHHRAGSDRDLGRALDARGAQVVGVEADQPAVVDEHPAAAVGSVQLAGQAAVADRDDALGDVRGAWVVRGQQDRRLLVAGQLRQQLEDGPAGGRVELAGDLVHEQQLRPDGDRDAQRRALLLAAGEL
jgi:hypothetical protein